MPSLHVGSFPVFGERDTIGLVEVICHDPDRACVGVKSIHLVRHERCRTEPVQKTVSECTMCHIAPVRVQNNALRDICEEELSIGVDLHVVQRVELATEEVV